MPKLPQLSGKECLRIFSKLGFYEVRQRGSHVVIRRGASGTVVPLHKELKTGTLHGLIRQAGITAEEFLEEYNK